jgi:glucosamine-6-phosphate deaminase
VIRLVIHRSASAASSALAHWLARTLSRHPSLVLGLPTGRTPIALYDELVRLHRKGRADFRRATTFNLDEFVGVAPDAPGSYAAFMRRHFFDHVNVRPSRRHIPNGAAPDLDTEAARYEQSLHDAGGLDIVIVGVGKNGHIGFNEPGRLLVARTHVARLRGATRRGNAWLFDGRWRDVPARAVSMGMGTILGARHVVLLATGKAKAAIVRQALTGPITTRVPASLLQAHPNVIVVLDRPAAGKLRDRAATNERKRVSRANGVGRQGPRE